MNQKMKPIWITLILTLGIGCSEAVKFEGIPVPNPPVGGGDVEVPDPDPDDKLDTTRGVVTPINIQSYGEVDVLVVIDNSGSMYKEQQEMAKRFNSFLSILDDMDWQVAITTTDVSSNWQYPTKGELLPFEDNIYYLHSGMNLSLANTLFANTIQREEEGSGDEQGIAATYYALEKRAEQTQHFNFFRDKSHLQVVLVSDENESDNDLENSPVGLLNLVDSTFGSDKSFRFHSIITRPGDKTCDDKWEHSTGHAYAELTALTNGILGDICADDYTHQLVNIGEDILNQFLRYELECEPLDLNNDGMVDVQVSFGSSDVVGYSVSGNVLTFADTPPIGSHEIRYTCLVESAE